MLYIDGFSLACRIDAYCALNKITKDTLCKETGISSTNLSQWRNRKGNPSRSKVRSLEEFVGMSIEAFMSDSFGGTPMKLKNKLVCQTVGDRMRRVRECRKLTQEELAMRSGLSVSKIQSYERNELTPPTDILGNIANALDCRVQFLFDGIPKVGDMTTTWKIGKRVSVPLEIDSDLLSVLERLAADEGRTINEKMEDTLWWEAERACEEADND